MACDVLPLDQGFLSIFCQLAACKVSDLLHGMTDLMCRAESLVCRKQIAGLLSALGNHTTSTQQMGGDIYKCERRALFHISSRLPQLTTKVWKKSKFRNSKIKSLQRVSVVTKLTRMKRVTRLTGRQGSQDSGLYWTVLGWLYWAALDCTGLSGLFYAVIGSTGQY